MKWVVPEHEQKIYLICACKYSRCPPICDATHISLPTCIRRQIDNCPSKLDHGQLNASKLCEQCGFVPEW